MSKSARVYSNKVFVTAVAYLMNRLRNQFFPAAAFSPNQNAVISLGKFFHNMKNLNHVFILSNHILKNFFVLEGIQRKLMRDFTLLKKLFFMNNSFNCLE